MADSTTSPLSHLDVGSSVDADRHICERIWQFLLSAECCRSDQEVPDFPDEISLELLKEWQKGKAESRTILPQKLTPDDRVWLRQQNFDQQVIQSFNEYPIPRTGPAARRAIDLPAACNTAQWDKETAFQLEMVRAREFKHVCPFSGEELSAIAGFWFHHQLLVYYFRGIQPFFVFISTVRTRRTVIYAPSAKTLLVYYPNDWRKPEDTVATLQEFLVKNWNSAHRYFSSNDRVLTYHAGFCWSIAHNLHDDLGGLQAVVDAGLADRIDKIVVGRNNHFGKIEEIFSDIPAHQFQHLEKSETYSELSVRYLKERYFPIRVFGTQVPSNLAEKVVLHCLGRCADETKRKIQNTVRRCYPLISITIRTRSRTWVDQVNGINYLVRSIASDFPNVGVVVDGVNQFASPDMVEEERQVSAELKASLDGSGVEIIDTIGCPLFESVAWANAVDMYVAPHGAGLTKCHWLGNKPGVVHSNHRIVSRVIGSWFDGTDIEDANAPLYVGPGSVKTRPASGEEYRQPKGDQRNDLDLYDCDWRDLDRMLRQLLRRMERQGRVVCLDRRQSAVETNRTHLLRSGLKPAISLKSEPRCAYGLYVPDSAIKNGPHLDTEVLVFVPGLVQTISPKKFMDLADEVGAIILHPYFPSDLSGDYDPSGYCHVLSDGVRYDLLLLQMLDEFSLRFGVEVNKIKLCGGSGGAQFAHRFMLLHPEKVSAVSLAAPASVTLPTEKAPWWAGMGDVASQFGFEPDLSKLKGLPVQIVIGDRDLLPVQGLSAKHWMDEAAVAGENRLERAKALAQSLQSLDADVELTVVPQVGHVLAKLWDYTIPYLRRQMSKDR